MLPDHTQQNPVSVAQELRKDMVLQWTLVGFTTGTTFVRPIYIKWQCCVLGRTHPAYAAILWYFEAVTKNPEFPSVYHTPSAYTSLNPFLILQGCCNQKLAQLSCYSSLLSPFSLDIRDNHCTNYSQLQIPDSFHDTEALHLHFTEPFWRDYIYGPVVRK